MARIWRHKGGGCEAIAKVEGNELEDEEVHEYLCPNKPTTTVEFIDGSSKQACQEHGEKWQKWWGAAKE